MQVNLQLAEKGGNLLRNVGKFLKNEYHFQKKINERHKAPRQSQGTPPHKFTWKDKLLKRSLKISRNLEFLPFTL